MRTMTEQDARDDDSGTPDDDPTGNEEPVADSGAVQESGTAADDVNDSGDADPSDARPPGKRPLGRQLSVSLRTLVVTGVVVALVAGVGILLWLYLGAQRQLDAQAREAANVARAEQIALDYATDAATMNYQDIPAWKDKLVAGTSPELNERLSGAADQMEQILVPLQWDSTARPLAAKVRSRAGSAITVDAFVSVLTRTVQGPDPLQSTATYSVTIDTDQDWQITDVGGIDAAVTGP